MLGRKLGKVGWLRLVGNAVKIVSKSLVDWGQTVEVSCGWWGTLGFYGGIKLWTGNWRSFRAKRLVVLANGDVVQVVVTAKWAGISCQT